MTIKLIKETKDLFCDNVKAMFNQENTNDQLAKRVAGTALQVLATVALVFAAVVVISGLVKIIALSICAASLYAITLLAIKTIFAAAAITLVISHEITVIGNNFVKEANHPLLDSVKEIASAIVEVSDFGVFKETYTARLYSAAEACFNRAKRE